MIRAKRVRPDAVIPTRPYATDAAFDLYSSHAFSLEPGERYVVPTGVALEIPPGLAGFIWDRSGLAAKEGLHVLGGVIDAGYRGEVGVCLINLGKNPIPFGKGDRIAQITFQQVYGGELEEATDLEPSPRDSAGWGSTGKK